MIAINLHLSASQARGLIAICQLQRLDLVDAHRVATLANDAGAARMLADMVAICDDLIATFQGAIDAADTTFVVAASAASSSAGAN